MAAVVRLVAPSGRNGDADSAFAIGDVRVGDVVDPSVEDAGLGNDAGESEDRVVVRETTCD